MPPAADNKPKNTLRKPDKLKSAIAIEALYSENQFIVSYPLKCYYSFSNNADSVSKVKVAFTVPKRTFKNAVNRNKIKRRMREAYRLNYKNILDLSNENEKQLLLFIIYIGKEELNYTTIEKNMQAVLQKIRKKVYSTIVISSNK